MELEEELKVVGNSLKSLEVSEEKVSYVELETRGRRAWLSLETCKFYFHSFRASPGYRIWVSQKHFMIECYFHKFLKLCKLAAAVKLLARMWEPLVRNIGPDFYSLCGY
jgi:hypothetical protein